jgi:hypothetical protein
VLDFSILIIFSMFGRVKNFAEKDIKSIGGPLLNGD